METISDLVSQYSTTLTLILGAIAVTGLLWRVVLRPMLLALRELGEQTAALRALAEAQLTTNGGGSLVDKVARIQPNHEAAEKHWEALESAQQAMAERLKKIEEKPAPTVVVNTAGPSGGGE